jgi:hypothetical protein
MIAIPVPSRRPAADPHHRMATAHHEAGHCVVARSLGLEVTLVNLEPHCHRDDPNCYWAQAVTGLAGLHAEQKFARYPFGTLAMMWQQDGRKCTGWG